MKRIVFLMAGLTAIVAVAVVLTLIIVNALRTPVNGPVRHYDALFTDASGLIVGNDVRISGVQVGKVEKIHLDGKNARITFNVLTDHPLYQNTTVAIRYQSLVGQRYVEIAQAPTPSALWRPAPPYRSARPFHLSISPSCSMAFAPFSRLLIPRSSTG
ncbi:mce related family protein [Mycobacteroides abscessus]|nr:mce related family protein [Mycobacteroides abscessus]